MDELETELLGSWHECLVTKVVCLLGCTSASLGLVGLFHRMPPLAAMAFLALGAYAALATHRVLQQVCRVRVEAYFDRQKQKRLAA